jgi:hypothetical protein
VTLLCLRNAKSGGLSSWSSSASVHNKILRRAPHLARALAGPNWYYDRKGEVRGLSRAWRAHPCVHAAPALQARRRRV